MKKIKNLVVGIAVLVGVLLLPYYLFLMFKGGAVNFFEGLAVSLVIVAFFIVEFGDVKSGGDNDVDQKVVNKLRAVGVKDFTSKELGVDLKKGDKIVSFISGDVYIITAVRKDLSYAPDCVMQYDVIEDLSGDTSGFWKRKPMKSTIYSYFDTYRKIENN